MKFDDVANKLLNKYYFTEQANNPEFNFNDSELAQIEKQGWDPQDVVRTDRGLENRAGAGLNLGFINKAWDTLWGIDKKNNGSSDQSTEPSTPSATSSPTPAPSPTLPPASASTSDRVGPPIRPTETQDAPKGDPNALPSSSYAYTTRDTSQPYPASDVTRTYNPATGKVDSTQTNYAVRETETGDLERVRFPRGTSQSSSYPSDVAEINKAVAAGNKEIEQEKGGSQPSPTPAPAAPPQPYQNAYGVNIDPSIPGAVQVGGPVSPFNKQGQSYTANYMPNQGAQSTSTQTSKPLPAQPATESDDYEPKVMPWTATK